MNPTNCNNCGKPLEIKPKNGVWGKEYQGKKGMYFAFVKCDDCGYSLSSDPNPRPRRVNSHPSSQMPLKQPNLPEKVGSNGLGLLKAMAKHIGMTQEEIDAHLL